MRNKVLLITIILLLFATTASASTLYEVKKGDSLTKIAKVHKVSVNELKSWNKLTKDSIYVKQKLIVQKPKAGQAPQNVVTVKPGTSAKTEVKVPSGEVKSEQIVKPPTIINEAKELSVSGQAIYVLLQDIAPRMQSIPYLYGGNTMAGFDCSGFIYFVHSQAGLGIIRQSSEGYFTQSATVTSPVVGDLAFFENTYKEGISHMGIYLGNNEFIHAGSKGVEITSLDSSYWKEHFVSFKRFYTVSMN
ncbi:NlpC/P60 family protein [Psychrobacillus sp. FSL H8-0483]|uniref:C40 family peptidase n=1 Tax=Psychrobacillus sp. FSL H8-0483 TaxID=2921389 RepID=UPI00315A765C